MIYERIVSTNDPDISHLTKVLSSPEISRYIKIDKNNYWNYVTTTENVYYFKVFDGDSLIAATHLELLDKTLYMDVMVVPEHQRKGIATKILNDIKSRKLSPDFERIEVSIDETNIASIALFEKSGFEFVSKDDELLNYIYHSNQQTI